MKKILRLAIIGLAGSLLAGCGDEPAANPAWQAMCEAYCTRGVECFSDVSLSECQSLCLDEVKGIPCEADAVLLDVCVTEAGALSCDEIQEGELPRVCDHMCTGGLCEGVDCDDGKECTDDICNPVDGSCDNEPLPDGTPCSKGGCEDLVCTSVFSCTEDGILTAIATGGGPYTFACDGPTTIETSDRIVVDKNVILNGEGNLTLDGRGLHTVFSVFGAPTDITVALHGFLVTGGAKDSAGISSNQANLTVSDCVVFANAGSGVNGRGTLIVNNTTLTDNGGEGIGHSGDFTANNNTILRNAGIGIGLWSDGAATINDTWVSENAGGGIHNGNGTLVLNHVTVSGNLGDTPLAGGISNDGTLFVNDSVVSGNGGEPYGGGGISNEHQGELTVNDTTISGNQSFGIANGGIATLKDSRVSENHGPGLAMNGGIATIVTSTISENQGDSGGGISNGQGTLFLSDSTVWGNTATHGGGIYSAYGTTTLTNCTVSGNTAVESGGGIHNRSDSTLISSTISGNSAGTAGAIYFATGHMTSVNSIIDGDCYRENHPMNASSDGGNIESPGDTCGFDQDTDRILTQAQLNLGPLTDNGGPTMTHKPGDGEFGDESDAIDRIPPEACLDAKGAPLLTDQRGLPRPVAILGLGPMCDVGSVERSAEP